LVTSQSDALIPVLEIGGTHVTSALVAMDEVLPTVVVRHRVGIDAQGAAEGLISLFTEAAHLLDPDRSRTVWGVAIPGPFDYEKGIAMFTGSNAKFASLNGVDVGAALTKALGPRATAIRFVNDASAFGLGECAAGAGRRHTRAVCLTLGTGVGSAFIAEGVTVEAGPTVPPEGSAYLLEWDGKPLEESVSRRAIRRGYEAVGGCPLDVRQIAELARAGDADAAAVLAHAMTALGGAIGPWVRLFAATVVVVGGSIAGSWDLLSEPLDRALVAASAPTHAELVPATLGDDAPLIGAADVAARLLSHPIDRGDTPPGLPET
jgi:glucokinase